MIIELWIFIGCPASATSPSTRVRSAMFPPNSVPTPIEGSPFSADIIPMNASGIADTKATRRKLVTNSVSFRYLAMCAVDFTAYSALLTSTMQATMNIITSFIIYFIIFFWYY